MAESHAAPRGIVKYSQSGPVTDFISDGFENFYISPYLEHSERCSSAGRVGVETRSLHSKLLVCEIQYNNSNMTLTTITSLMLITTEK